MKIMILATGKIEEREDSYAARLIEQGRAVLPPLATERQAGRKLRRSEDTPAAKNKE